MRPRCRARGVSRNARTQDRPDVCDLILRIVHLDDGRGGRPRESWARTMRPPLFVLTFAVLLFGASACGSSSSSSSSPPTSSPTSATGPSATTSGAASGSGTSAGGATATAPPVTTTLKLSADPTGALKFDKTKLTAKSGRVTIEMKNDSSVPHDIAVEGEGLTEQG